MISEDGQLVTDGATNTNRMKQSSDAVITPAGNGSLLASMSLGTSLMMAQPG